MSSPHRFSLFSATSFTTVTIVVLLTLVVFARLDIWPPWSREDFIERGIRIQVDEFFNGTENLFTRTSTKAPFSPSNAYSRLRHPKHSPQSPSLNERSYFDLETIHALEPLLSANIYPNPITHHIRVSSIVQNISMAPPDKTPGIWPTFNPTIMALPYWSSNQYLLVNRVVTEGLHQESLMCEANTCYAGGSEGRRAGERDCDENDLAALGSAGGLRCAHDPIVVNVPPTPSEQCEGEFAAFASIPGFHDPRIFWSGKGEPLIVVNSHSRYACFGLWITDLRNLHSPLRNVLSAGPDKRTAKAPPISYPSLIELTRNPRSTRNSVEKNWFLFFPSPSTSYLHYELSWPSKRLVSTDNGGLEEKYVGGRSFAKLIGNGFTTPNLTSSKEAPCLPSGYDSLNRTGKWHQASNSLKLILCRRAEINTKRCSQKDGGRTIHFALIHRKFSNEWDLPLRYERYFVVWETQKPFTILGMSRFPIQLWNETASGWSSQENWNMTQEETRVRLPSKKRNKFGWFITSDVRERSVPFSNETLKHTEGVHRDYDNKRNWAYFTYTPSIAWAWRPKSGQRSRGTRVDTEQTDESTSHLIDDGFTSLQTGYLDDEVILGIGIDDREQVFGRAKAETLLQGLRLCPAIDDSKRKYEQESGANPRLDTHETARETQSKELTTAEKKLSRGSKEEEKTREPEGVGQKDMVNSGHIHFD